MRAGGRLRSVGFGLRALFGREKVEREGNDELRMFLELAVEDKERQGMSPSEARRAVSIERGQPDGAREAVRSAGWEWAVEAFWQDVRHGARRLRRAPAFSIAAIAMLALGIGANTAIFSLVNRVLLQPLPYREAGRLVAVWGRTSGAGDAVDLVSSPDYADWKAESHSFAAMGAATDAMYSMTGAGDPVSVIAYRFSAEFFNTLGVPAMLGRTFSPDEDQAGKEREVVLSYRLWRTRFGGDRAAVGRSIRLDGKPQTIVGVMPAGFDYPPGTELWTPLTTDPSVSADRNARWLRVMARLKDGVTLAQAAGEMTTIAARLQAQYPATNRNQGVKLIPLREQVSGNARPALLVLLGGAGLVLLIACVNMANLLLARALRRRGEIAMRMALGASRLRILRQLLAESLPLSLAGGGLGVAIAWWAANALVAMFPRTAQNTGLPALDSISIDAWVLGFAVAVSLATGMLFGLAPALLVSHERPGDGLTDRGRHAGCALAHGVGGRRARNLMVTLEMALSLMLLVAAGLMAKSFVRLATAKLGFRTDHELTFRVLLPQDKYATDGQQAAFRDAALRRIQSLPGVTSAGTVTFLPLSGWWGVRQTTGAEVAIVPGKDYPKPVWSSVSPYYFRAIGIPLLEGRDFGDEDAAGAAPVAILSASLARHLWPDRDALGNQVKVAGIDRRLTVVGVVGDIHQLGVGSEMTAEGADPIEEVYLAAAQQPGLLLCFVVRTPGDAMGLVRGAERSVWAVDRQQPLSYVESMDQLASESLLLQQASMILLAVFAALALLLAAVGVYGVLSYTAGQRTQEIGVRLALGASRAEVVRMVMGEGLRWAALGLALGTAGALALTRLLGTLLYGVNPGDPWIFGSGSAVLAGVAVLACYLPARRASRMDAAAALRWG